MFICKCIKELGRGHTKIDRSSFWGGKRDWGRAVKDNFLISPPHTSELSKLFRTKNIYFSCKEGKEWKYNSKYMINTKGWPQRLMWWSCKLCNCPPHPFSLSSESCFAQEWVHVSRDTWKRQNNGGSIPLQGFLELDHLIQSGPVRFKEMPRRLLVKLLCSWREEQKR